MCGIIGINGGGYHVSEPLFKGLKALEYRGYDSCGMAIYDGDNINIRKHEGTVDEVNEKVRFLEMHGQIGIAHTRWATHGKVNQTNSHPHTSNDGKFAIIHNGIISNYKELKLSLIKKGFEFSTETDTEVAANLIQDNYASSGDVATALRRAARMLDGTYAILVLSSHDPNTIYAARLESPLIIGLGNEANYIGSDANAFIAHTRQAVSLDDGEYAIIGRDSYQIRNTSTNEIINRNSYSIPWDISESEKGGFSHYMLKEIHEQPNAIRQALAAEEEQAATLAEAINECRRTVLTGVGTTFYVAMFGQYVFNRLAGRYLPAISSDELEFSTPLDEDTLTIAASQSGETYDTLRALKYAKAAGGKTGAIVNVVGSTMSRLVDNTIIQGSGPEICVISTKAALAQMLILTRLAMATGEMNGHLEKEEAKAIRDALGKLPQTVSRLINEQSGAVRSIANSHLKMRHWLFLGKGLYYPVALESALKMKEVSYIHSEGMPAGFLKHGTLALIDEKVNTLVFTPHRSEGHIFDATHSAAEEIKARSGYIVGFGYEKDDMFDQQVVLPHLHPVVDPLLQLIVGQLFSYFTAVGLGLNIDKPRSLAKSVTVP